MSEHDPYQAVLDGIRDIHATWCDFEARMRGEIGEYKKTVNTAIGLLADEAIRFQRETAARIDADVQQRIARQKRTDRVNAAVLSAVGCLIIVNALTAGAAIVAVIWLLSVRGG